MYRVAAESHIETSGVSERVRRTPVFFLYSSFTSDQQIEAFCLLVIQLHSLCVHHSSELSMSSYGWFGPDRAEIFLNLNLQSHHHCINS